VIAAKDAHALGIPAICIFPYTELAARTHDCAMAWSPENVSNRAIRAIKDAVPDIAIMTDIALDPYNINGHDGFVVDGEADMVMVKPGMPYLDICRSVKDTFGVPTYAYQVSGEYAMLMAAGQNGWLEKDKVMMESLLSFKRAGCDGILTYFAPDAARLLSG